MHAVLDRHGLVKRGRRRRRNKAEGTTLSQALAPNQLWRADFKGEFRLGIKEVDDGVWLVSFMQHDLGYIDLEQKNFANYRQPVRHEGVAYVLGAIRYPCLRVGHWWVWRARRDSNPRPPD